MNNLFSKTELFLIALFFTILLSGIGYMFYNGYTDCGNEHLRNNNGPYELGCKWRGEDED